MGAFEDDGPQMSVHSVYVLNGDRVSCKAVPAQGCRVWRTLVRMGDVLLDVTVPDRATASIIRAAIETAIPTDVKSGVDLQIASGTAARSGVAAGLSPERHRRH
jgi:hypothetical protein